jgi:hypothetical protein
MTTPGTTDTSGDELRKKLLEIYVWAMLLVIALVLERTSDSVVFIAGALRGVESKVWASVFIMVLVFGILLATTVGILALHVHFGAKYKYWYIIVDNIFITVPLYVAVRFIAASVVVGKSSTVPVRLDEGLFRAGAAMITVSFVFLFVRDLIVLPQIHKRISVPPLALVSTLHFLGVLLFLWLAIAPEFILYASVICLLGLCSFFAGMAAIPFFDKHFGVATPDRAPVPGSS